MSKILISCCVNALDVRTQDQGAAALIKQIKSHAAFKARVDVIRAAIKAGDGEKVKRLKLKLPGVLWSGRFKKRSAEHLIAHSGLLCADLDDLLDVGKTRARLQASKHLYALFASPSGNGLKAIFKVPADAARHAGSFAAAQAHVKELTGLDVDESCKDVARLCFISYDPKAYLNEAAAELKPFRTREAPGSTHDGDAPAITRAELSNRQRVAERLLGEIKWLSGGNGLCRCPEQAKHTNQNGPRDCKVFLSGNVPTIHCFHTSCLPGRAAMNKRLRGLALEVESGEPIQGIQTLGTAASDAPRTKGGFPKGLRTVDGRSLDDATYLGLEQVANLMGRFNRERAIFDLDGERVSVMLGQGLTRRNLPHARPAPPAILVKSLLDLTPVDEENDEATTLLGNRWLARDGSALFVGSAGIGKTTATIQFAINWAIGQPCFGIHPRIPLKILYVQSENDEGDLSEMRDGVLSHYELTKDELALLRENFIVAFENSRVGVNFVANVLRPLLHQHQPDLIVLDPALSFLGGDANKQEVVGEFLRTLIAPLLKRFNCGIFIIHHTAKPVSRDNIGKISTDFAYFGAGSAEWANFARGVLTLTAKDDAGLRELRIGKRFRLGWPSFRKLLRQNPEGGTLFYTELTEDEMVIYDSELEAFEKAVEAKLVPAFKEEISRNDLIAKIVGAGLCKERKAIVVINQLIKEGYIERFTKERVGKKSEVWFRGIQGPLE